MPDRAEPVLRLGLDIDDDMVIPEGQSPLRYDEGMQDDYCLPAPSHPPELDRLQHMHNIYSSTVGNLPVEVEQMLADDTAYRILDVGCGTGVCFEIMDVTLGLKFDDDKFDIVHVRDIGMGIRDHASLLGEAVRVLRPGGWLVASEPELRWYRQSAAHGTDDRYPHLVQFTSVISRVDNVEDRLTPSEIFCEALRERGLDPRVADNLQETMSETSGLVEVTHRRVEVPIVDKTGDPHAGYIAQEAYAAFKNLITSSRIMMQDHGIANPVEIGAEALAEIDQDGEGLLWYFHRCWARKRQPLEESV